MFKLNIFTSIWYITSPTLPYPNLNPNQVLHQKWPMDPKKWAQPTLGTINGVHMEDTDNEKAAFYFEILAHKAQCPAHDGADPPLTLRWSMNLPLCPPSTGMCKMKITSKIALEMGPDSPEAHLKEEGGGGAKGVEPLGTPKPGEGSAPEAPVRGLSRGRAPRQTLLQKTIPKWARSRLTGENVIRVGSDHLIQIGKQCRCLFYTSTDQVGVAKFGLVWITVAINVNWKMQKKNIKEHNRQTYKEHQQDQGSVTLTNRIYNLIFLQVVQFCCIA